MTTDIALLFARDPLKLTDEDINTLIAKMREQRKSFSAPKAPATTTTVRQTRTRTARPPSALAESLSKLDLDIKL